MYYDYYRYYCVCEDGPVNIGMADLDGNETTSYPVFAFDVNEAFIGIANNKAEYITLWNSDPDNQAVGVLSSGMGPFGFSILLNAGQVMPLYVFGVPVAIEDPGDPGEIDGIYGFQYAVQYV